VAVEREGLELGDEQQAALDNVEVKHIEEQIEPNPAAKDPGAEQVRVSALEARLLDEAEDTLNYLLEEAGRRPDSLVPEELRYDAQRIDALATSVQNKPLSRPLTELPRGWSLTTTKPADDESESPLWEEMRKLQRGDIFWTLLSAVVASTAYALTIWDDTWGTVTDFATAFTAGFLTDTIVNWAVLPAFQSYRARRRAAAQEEEKKEEEAKPKSLLEELQEAARRVTT
jgi:hypothetical protein